MQLDEDSTAMIEPKVLRTDRKTLAIQVKPGEVIVRAPIRATDQQIREFLAKHDDWIRKTLNKLAIRSQQQPTVPCLTEADVRSLADKALVYIPERVRHYAPQVGVSYGRITIRNQRSRWGSCSAKGNLNFNCLLMLTPPEVIDSVIVHELCHRKEMNHSERFYAEVLRVFPDYQKWHRWLKENGEAIMQRMTG